MGILLHEEVYLLAMVNTLTSPMIIFTSHILLVLARDGPQSSGFGLTLHFVGLSHFSFRANYKN